VIEKGYESLGVVLEKRFDKVFVRAGKNLSDVVDDSPCRLALDLGCSMRNDDLQRLCAFL
jgi:hypothetical protein